MSYLDGPFRPRWCRPLLIFWAIFGMPVVPVGMFYRGSLNPLPGAPPVESFDNPVAVGAWLLLIAWVYLPPVLLIVVELVFRRRMAQIEEVRAE